MLSIILLGFLPCLLDPLGLQLHLPETLEVETELVFLIISEHLCGHSSLFLKNSMCLQTELYGSVVQNSRIWHSLFCTVTISFSSNWLSVCSYNHIISFSSDSPATSLGFFQNIFCYLLKYGQTEHFPNPQVLVPFCLTILCSIYFHSWIPM